MKYRIVLLLLLIIISVSDIFSQNKESVEITAQSILARVDRIMQYSEGELQGRLKHIFPDGNSFTVDFKGNITRNDFLFNFSSVVYDINNFTILFQVEVNEILPAVPFLAAAAASCRKHNSK